MNNYLIGWKKTPSDAKTICKKIIDAASAREAARKARDLSRKKCIRGIACQVNLQIAKKRCS